MGAIETASAIAIVMGAVAYCIVKTIAQIESNKFKICKCCGNECVRDVQEPTQMVEVEHALQQTRETSTNGIIDIGQEIKKAKGDNVFIPKNDRYFNSPRPQPRPHLEPINE